MCSFDLSSSVAVREAECAEQLLDQHDQTHHTLVTTLRNAITDLASHLARTDRGLIKRHYVRSISLTSDGEPKPVYDMVVFRLGETEFYVPMPSTELYEYTRGLVTLSDDGRHGLFHDVSEFVQANNLAARKQYIELLVTIAEYQRCAMAARSGDGIEG